MKKTLLFWTLLTQISLVSAQSWGQQQGFLNKTFQIGSYTISMKMILIGAAIILAVILFLKFRKKQPHI